MVLHYLFFFIISKTLETSNSNKTCKKSTWIHTQIRAKYLLYAERICLDIYLVSDLL